MPSNEICPYEENQLHLHYDLSFLIIAVQTIMKIQCCRLAGDPDNTLDPVTGPRLHLKRERKWEQHVLQILGRKQIWCLTEPVLEAYSMRNF